MANINCPKCGTINDDASGQFCKQCGSSLHSPARTGTPMPYGGYRPEPSRKKNKNLLIAALVVVVALVVIIAIVASLVNNSNDGSPFSDTNMEVTKIAPYISYESFGQPSEGNKFVVVYLNFTNEYSSDVDLNPFYFTMICTNDMAYSYSWKIDYSMADVAPADSTTPIVLYFEIPESAQPSEIKYDGLYSMYDCSAELTSAWTSDPVQGQTSARLSDLSYSVVTDYDPYFPPEDGNRYINVTVRITNLLTTALDLNPYYFELTTSYGLVHEKSIWVDTPAMPEGLLPGRSIIVSIGYEVGLNEQPVELMFDDHSYFTSITF